MDHRPRGEIEMLPVGSPEVRRVFARYITAIPPQHLAKPVISRHAGLAKPASEGEFNQDAVPLFDLMVKAKLVSRLKNVSQDFMALNDGQIGLNPFRLAGVHPHIRSAYPGKLDFQKTLFLSNLRKWKFPDRDFAKTFKDGRCGFFSAHQ
jgi:hypothetical protein